MVHMDDSRNTPSPPPIRAVRAAHRKHRPPVFLAASATGLSQATTFTNHCSALAQVFLWSSKRTVNETLRAIVSKSPSSPTTPSVVNDPGPSPRDPSWPRNSTPCSTQTVRTHSVNISALPNQLAPQKASSPDPEIMQQPLTTTTPQSSPAWEIPSTTQVAVSKSLREEGRDTLCDKCWLLDLKIARPHTQGLLRKRHVYATEISIPHQERKDLRGSCGMCKLLSRIWPWYFSPPCNLTLTENGKCNRGKLKSHSFYVAKSDVDGEMFSSPDSITPLLVKVPLQAKDQLPKPEINFHALKSWINTCCDTHGAVCGRSFNRSRIEGLKLINIKTRRVFRASYPGVEYAALSYVFGATPVNFSASDELPATLPRTIEDGFEVTRRLGLSYLWVDRYCIRQDDALEKYNQIRQMHLIFRQAHVTIVATAGNGPEYGIPGISRPRREIPHVSIDDHVYAATPDPDLEVRRSKWFSRAWTYQEQVLSRRLLYFLDTETLFRCNQTRSDSVENPVRNFNDESLRESPGEYNEILSRILRHLLEACSRDISFESDRVNAIEGIFGLEQERGAIMGHLCGIPIYSEDPILPSTTRTAWDDGLDYSLHSFPYFRTQKAWEDGLISGLTWVLDTEKRRMEFPSWTWAGWKCKPDLWAFQPSTNSENIRIWIELNSGETEQLRQVDTTCGAGSKPPVTSIVKIGPHYCVPSKKYSTLARSLSGRLSNFLHIESPIIRCKFRRPSPIFTWWTVSHIEGQPFNNRSISTQLHLDIRYLVSELALPLDSKEWRGLLFVQSGSGGTVLFIEDHADHSERIGICPHITIEEWPFEPQLEMEDGSSRAIFPDEGTWKPHEMKITLRKETVRLG